MVVYAHMCVHVCVYVVHVYSSACMHQNLSCKWDKKSITGISLRVEEAHHNIFVDSCLKRNKDSFELLGLV